MNTRVWIPNPMDSRLAGDPNPMDSRLAGGGGPSFTAGSSDLAPARCLCRALSFIYRQSFDKKTGIRTICKPDSKLAIWHFSKYPISKRNDQGERPVFFFDKAYTLSLGQ